MKKLFPRKARRRAETQLSANLIPICRRDALRSALLLAVITTALTACAHISFHDPSNPGRNIGLEYYKPKLFLLVAKNKDGTTKADILTLPDLARPRYALLHPGYGSSNLALKLNNGVLTDVGQTVDTKIPETITALGSLATAVGGIPKGPQSVGAEKPEPSFRLFEIIMRDDQVRLKEVSIP